MQSNLSRFAPSHDKTPFLDTQHPYFPKESSSPEYGMNMQRSLQIDMKYLIGDAVGNISISPTSRDLVLATKRGLFILDLKAPLEVPRFLPQVGTWDVADVQWNPHSSRAEYIVSTSCEKLFIWNLLSEKTPIQHILRSHYRAITDINWHTTEPDMVSSTGIDSWIWSWDLRQNPVKPAFGLSAFSASGTQVKWNRQDANILASSHSDAVLIWDRRNGSLPVRNIKAHKSKIYGIDWSNNLADEILTCSLDKTIKVWNVQCSDDDPKPKFTVCTKHPIWRARDLPFGEGLLSLPQRGGTALEMWSRRDNQAPVEVLEGHTDVVKESVWRKGEGPSEFQLITWSKDRTLRFWPVDADMMEKVGHQYVPRLHSGPHRSTTSFRNLPPPAAKTPTLSVPIGKRSILAEVRATIPQHQRNLVLQPHENSSLRKIASKEEIKHQDAISIPVNLRRGGTMSRVTFGGRSVRQLDAFAWLSSVTVGAKREGSSGPATGTGSHLSSKSRQSSGREQRGREQLSITKSVDEIRQVEDKPSLQDEITSVLTKLASAGIKLEKHDLMKKRTCTLGLHGPWGESSSVNVFMRITFTFPKEYPRPGPEGTPAIDLERNPLISLRKRAFILRRLRFIRENRRPCLESCLQFLLFDREDVHTVPPHEIQLESSDEDDMNPESRKSQDVTVSLLRSHKNLAEPRTSQGIFSPSGHLVCFFSAPRRVFHTAEPLIASPGRNDPDRKSQLKPPALIADAIHQLSSISLGRPLRRSLSRAPDDAENIGRIMTNMLTFSPNVQEEPTPDPHEPTSDDQHIQSTVFINNSSRMAGPDCKVANEYLFQAGSLSELCETNAILARDHGRFDHQRAFFMLRGLFPSADSSEMVAAGFLPPKGGTLAWRVMQKLYSDFCSEKDVQMLAMIAVVILQMRRSAISDLPDEEPRKDQEKTLLSSSSVVSSGKDYFSLVRHKEDYSSPLSPIKSRFPLLSPLTGINSYGAGNSGASRGSWSSLFNPGSVRQLIGNAQEAPRREILETTPVQQHSHQPISVPQTQRAVEFPRFKIHAQHSPLESSPNPSAVTSKSWSETAFRGPGTMKRTSTRQRPALRLPMSSSISHAITFKEGPAQEKSTGFFSDVQAQKALVGHILAYADVLFEWRFYHKRAELLKTIGSFSYSPHHGRSESPLIISLTRPCLVCNIDIAITEGICPSCGSQAFLPRCSICRLVVKGLSRSCLICKHILHISCWKKHGMMQLCPTGCGCSCSFKSCQ